MLLKVEWRGGRGARKFNRFPSFLSTSPGLAPKLPFREGLGDMSAEGTDCNHASGDISSWQNHDRIPFPKSWNNLGALLVPLFSLSLQGSNLKLRHGENKGKWRAFLLCGANGGLSAGEESDRTLAGSALIFIPGCKAARGVATVWI